MITLRLTRKLQALFEIDLPEQLLPTTNKLGDWYANFIPTESGDLILMVNEKTLLSVAVPIWESDHWLVSFHLRVTNLLAMIGIPFVTILQELHHYKDIQFDNTKSRSVLGSMNDIAYQYQVIAEMTNSMSDLSLSNAEYRMSEVPFKSIGFRFPREIAKELLV
jgi:hypothetical protein